MDPYLEELVERKNKGWEPVSYVDIEESGTLFRLNVTKADSDGYSDGSIRISRTDEFTFWADSIWATYDLGNLVPWLQKWLDGGGTDSEPFGFIEAGVRFVQVPAEIMSERAVEAQVSVNFPFEQYFAMPLYEDDVAKLVGYLNYQLPRLKKQGY